MSDNDLELLARYSGKKAEDAFAEIVRRHVDLVYSAALRQVRSPQLAEEVAQATFLSLAHDANRLTPDTILAAWLYRVAHRTAANVVRREARRQLREQIATEMHAMNATDAEWTHIEPLLDEAMQALDNTDRTAVLLRYFEKKSLREVGAMLGASENAVQKRLGRAVERLRKFFAKRGVTVGASGLVVIISANAVQAAPVGLAVTISTAVALVPTILTTMTAAVGKAIAMTTMQKALIASALAAAIGTGLYEASEASTLRAQVQTLRQQQQTPLAELDRLRAEKEPAANKQAELLRLRGQVGVPRQELAQAQQRLARSATQTNNPAASWTVGENKAMAALKDAGLGSPLAAAETFWWAAANNNFERMKQSIVFDHATDAEQVSDAYAKREAQNNGGLLQSLESAGVRLTSHNSRWLDDDRTTIEFQVTGARLLADGTMGNIISGQSIQLLRVGDEWKVVRDEKQVHLSIMDDDSEAVAKMMLQMDGKALESLKADPRLPARTLRAYEAMKANGAQ